MKTILCCFATICLFLSVVCAHIRMQSSFAESSVDQPPMIPIDCNIRALAIQFAGALQPADFGTPQSSQNWSAITSDGLQMNTLCANVPIIHSAPRRRAPQQRPIHQAAQCDWTCYVDGTNGADNNPGTLSQPVQTVQRAIQLSRGRDDRRLFYPCVYVRQGVYYLGDLPPKTSESRKQSQIGAIALTATDNGLTISSYNGEDVTFSGGRLIQPTWSVYKNTSAGTIYSTPLPANILTSWSELNEVYVDNVRAVRAKYPNGDPSVHGLYSDPSDTGFLQTSKGWLPSKSFPPSTHIAATPERTPSAWPAYSLSVGGFADVYNPPHTFWADYHVPGGVQWNENDFSPRAANWSHPETGLVFAFHGSYWGSWVFDIDSVDANTRTITFGKGGFQEARGTDHGKQWYVSNILEELDAPHEWFVDSNTKTLYFMPNVSAPTPKVFVVSQLSCILSMHGNPSQPITNITINGITFAHTSNTFMSDYEVPSGGDWSIHRGGAVFLYGTSNVTIVQSMFTQLGSNAIVVSDYNQMTTITRSEFAWLGESGVIIVGSTNGIDGISNLAQPNKTTISNNLFREVGIYVKQAGPVFQAVAFNSLIDGNVFLNMPRSAVNMNDGFGGGTNVSHNLLFNAVRETTDHGAFNSWDRQPYLTLQPDGSAVAPSLIPATNYLSGNFFFAGYGSNWPVDHDDGSCYYRDFGNVLVYGGYKNYLGHSKQGYSNLYLFPDMPRPMRGTRSPVGGDPTWGMNCMYQGSLDPGTDGYDEYWYNNTCLMYTTTFYTYRLDGCDASKLKGNVPTTNYNTFYYPDGGQFYVRCEVNGQNVNITLNEYQTNYGFDQSSTQQSSLPSIQVWSQQVKTLLGFN